MRWAQFLLAVANLSFATYILALNVFLVDVIDPFTFLWALVYIALSVALTHLYMLYMSNKLDDWYDVESIRSITNLSIVSLTISAIAMIAFFGQQYYYTKTIVFLNPDHPLKMTLVPLAASVVCSAMLFTSSIKFKKYVTLCGSIDLQPTQRTTKNYRTAG